MHTDHVNSTPTSSLIMSTIQDNNNNNDSSPTETRNLCWLEMPIRQITWLNHMTMSHDICHMIYHMTMSHDTFTSHDIPPDYIHITWYTTWPGHMTTSHDHITLKDHLNDDSQHTSARARCLYVTCSFVLFTSSTMTISLSRTIQTMIVNTHQPDICMLSIHIFHHSGLIQRQFPNKGLYCSSLLILTMCSSGPHQQVNDNATA